MKTLITSERKAQMKRFGAIALMLTLFISFMAFSGTTVFAGNAVGGAAGGATNAATGALDNVMDIVIDIISKAALYIGIVIVLWGVFQIILAFRREDSEGISKQITTVVVGGVLVGFGALANSLYNVLTS